MLKRPPIITRFIHALNADRLAIHVLENGIHTDYFDDAVETHSSLLEGRLEHTTRATPHKERMPTLSLTLLPYGEKVRTYTVPGTEFFSCNVGYLCDLSQQSVSAKMAPPRILCASTSSLNCGDDTRRKTINIVNNHVFGKYGVMFGNYGVPEIEAHISESINRYGCLEKAVIGPEGLEKGNFMLDALARSMRNPGAPATHDFNEVLAAVSKEHCVGIVIPKTPVLEDPFLEHWVILKACVLAIKSHKEGRFLPILMYDCQGEHQAFIPIATQLKDVFRLLDKTEERRKTLDAKGNFFDGKNPAHRLKSFSDGDLEAIIKELNQEINHHYSCKHLGKHALKLISENDVCSGIVREVAPTPSLLSEYETQENTIICQPKKSLPETAIN